MRISANAHRMVLLLTVSFVSLLTVCTSAQEAETPPPGASQPPPPTAEQVLQQIRDRSAEAIKSVTEKKTCKILEVKNAAPGSVAKLLGNFAEVTADGGRFIAVSGTAEQVAAAEEALQKIDVPEVAESVRNVEIRIFLICASNAVSETPSSLPDTLKPLEAPLNERFSYSEYRLLDTLVLRCRDDGGAEASCVVKLSPEEVLRFHINLRDIRTISRDKGHLVSIGAMVCGGAVESSAPVEPQPQGRRPVDHGEDSGISSQVDVLTGEPTMVGKISLSASGEAIVIALMAEVTQL